jgi:hypothetical protein
VDHLPAGKYIFRIEVVDMFNNSVYDEVWVTVLPASNTIPTLTSPDDLQLMVNASTASISWSVQDPQCCYATYSIYRNGTLIQNGSWISQDLIIISVASLPVGTYNFTIVVDDGFEGVSFDTVLVSILPTPNPPEPEPNFWENLKIEYIAIISFCGVGAILLIIRLKKR